MSGGLRDRVEALLTNPHVAAVYADDLRPLAERDVLRGEQTATLVFLDPPSEAVQDPQRRTEPTYSR